MTVATRGRPAIAATLILALCAPMSTAGEREIVLLPAAGTAIRYVQKMRVASDGESVVALAHTIETEQELELVFGETDAEGVRAVEIRHGRIHGTIVSPMHERVVFDSATEGSTTQMLAVPVVAQLEMLDGHTVRARVDAKGRVLEVDGFTDLYRGTPVEFMYAMTGYPFTDALFLDDVQALFALLPVDPVADGARWTTTQVADFTGVLLQFPLSSFASHVDDEEAAWSYASVGTPVPNVRRAAARDDLPHDVDPLSRQGAAQTWIERGIEITDGTISGFSRVGSRDGVAIELRHEARARGTSPHPAGAGRVAMSWSLAYELTRDGAPHPAVSRPGPAPATKDRPDLVARLVDSAAELQVGRTIAGEFRGDEPSLVDHREAAPLCTSYRVRVEGAGRHTVTLRSPGFGAALVVCDPLGSLSRTATDERGAAEVHFEVRDPQSGILVLVEAAADARGPFLLELRAMAADQRFEAADSVTPFDGAQLLDPTALLAGDAAERERLLAYYRLLAASIERFGGSPTLHVHFHVLHAMACRANGDATEARRAVDRAWELFARTDGTDVNVRFELLGIESGLSREEGRPGRARTALDELSALASHTSIHPLLASLVLHDLAVLLLEELGDREQAHAIAREGLAILADRDIEEPRVEASLRQVIALAIAVDDPLAAETEIRTALAGLRVAGGEESGLAAALRGQLAELLEARDDPVAARREAMEALDSMVCAGGFDHDTVALLLERIADVETRAGRFERAFHARQDALAIRIAWSGSAAPRTRPARVALAASLARIGRSSDAWNEIALVVDDDRGQLGARIAALTERERLAYQATQRAALDLAHELESTDPREARIAYDTALLAKGAVARSLDAERARLRSASPEESARIATDLRAVEASLATLTGSPEAAASTRSRRDALERELARAAPVGDAEPAVDATHVGESLPVGGVLVDFVVHGASAIDAARGPRISAWITHAGEQDSRRIDLGAAAPIEEAVSAWRAAIDPRGARGIAAVAVTTEDSVRPGAELARLLVDPLRAEIEGALRILICPDGFLAGVPFGALPSADDGFLLEEFAIDYAHDASRIARGAEAGISTNEALFVGGLDYSGAPGGISWAALPGTSREIEKLAQLQREFRGERSVARIMSGSDGTESRIRMALGRAGTIHIATHGHVEFAHDDGETRSALVCALERGARPEPGESDGLLTAEEIAWLDLSRARLVVLSACSSGLGRAVPGEGMLGLRRAFRRAGAHSVVSALWPVPDEATAELMTDFYTRMWSDGLAPEDALRGAQLAALNAARERGEGASPLAWGAFVIE